MSRLLLVLLVALLARLAAWGVAERQVAARDDGSRFVVAGDAEGYWDLAGDLAGGREYAVHEPPRRVMRTPGLPLVLAGVRVVFGDSPTAARGVMAVLGVLGPWLVYLLGRELVDARTGLLAAALAAVSPLVVGFSATLLSESLFGAAITGQMFAIARLRRFTQARNNVPPLNSQSVGEREHVLSQTIDKAAWIGFAGAVACYLRPAWTPAMAAIPVGWLIVRRSWLGVAEASMIAAIFAVLWMPWVMRNNRVVGRPVLTTLWTGPTLYDSVGPQANGASDMTFFDVEAPQRAGWSEAEMNADYTRRSIAAMQDDPLRIARLAVAKQLRYWSLAPSADEAGPAWLRVPIAAWTLLFFAACVVGATRVSWTALGLTAGPVLALAAIHLVFVASMRYRIPAELPLCVLAACGILEATSREISSKPHV